jgi:glucosamine--fructose-6-phosphate aminotransferase (isomerizing)
MNWLGKFPDPFLAEIAGQAEAIRRAAGSLEEQVPTLDALGDAAGRGGGVVFTGMGSSYDACYPAVNELAARGVPALHVDAAELLHFRTNALSSDTVLVVVSQSGESAEIVRLAASLNARPDPPLMTSLTNGLANGLAERADLRLDTRAGPETGPSTMTFAASMALLAAVAPILGGDTTADATARARTGAERAAGAVEAFMEVGDATGSLLEDVVDGREILAVLGRGSARAAAEMGALTLKESGVMAESFATASFRHGPFELAGPDMAAIILSTEEPTRTLDLGLAADLASTGASVAVIAPGEDVPAGCAGVHLPDLDRLFSSTVGVVPIQLLAWRLALRHGRAPGVYTRASKVTTRE